MQAKTDMVEFATDLNIDQLIQEGLKKANECQQLASEQAEKLAQEQIDGLEIEMQKINCFQFQEKDYHEVRKQLQDSINQRVQEEMLGQVNEHGVFVRPQRAGAQAAMEAMKDGHDQFKAHRAN